MNKWEADLIKWIFKHFCPKPPKPQPYLDLVIGPVQLKDPKMGH